MGFSGYFILKFSAQFNEHELQFNCVVYTDSCLTICQVDVQILVKLFAKYQHSLQKNSKMSFSFSTVSRDSLYEM